MQGQNYYLNQLGLKDWKKRANLRLNEEVNFTQNENIKIFENIYGIDFSKNKVLIVGSGTGGEIINFSKKCHEVYGVETNIIAIEISNFKIDINNIKNAFVKSGESELLPFDDNSFDFVSCYTVLEHVNDVEKSIKEMIRVTKHNGKIFIETPDYRQFYDPHYKLLLPMFLPKIFIKLIQILLGRPLNFLNSLNFVSSRI